MVSLSPFGPPSGLFNSPFGVRQAATPFEIPTLEPATTNAGESFAAPGFVTLPQGGLDPRSTFDVSQGLLRNVGNTGGLVAPFPGISIPTGNTGEIGAAEVNLATGGDPVITETLLKVAQDPDGASALRIALNSGTTFQRGQLEGNVVGLTEFGPGPPVITLEDPTSVDTAAHEIAHAAFPEMDHDLVYEFGHQVARNLGEPTI